MKDRYDRQRCTYCNSSLTLGRRCSNPTCSDNQDEECEMTETERFDAALDRILSDMTAEEVAMIPGVRGVLVQELYSVIVDEMDRSDDK